MDLFSITGNTVFPTPEALLIPEFGALWDRATDVVKRGQALKELAYIYFNTDYKSVYQAYSPAVRSEQICKDIFGNTKYKPDKQVKSAIQKYEELQITFNMRYLRAAKNAAESTMSYFNNVDYEERDQNGRPIYKINEVTQALARTGEVLESLEKLEEKVKLERLTTAITKGGKEVGKFEE